MRDKSCASIVKLMMKYSPDAVAWFDYSTAPPMLNIGKRGALGVKEVQVYGGSDFVSAFGLRPRYNLLVPCVIAKFQSNLSVNGKSMRATTVQKFRPACWTTRWRLVQTIDLVGSSETTQSQTVFRDFDPHRNDATAPQILAWLLRHLPTLPSLYDFQLWASATSPTTPGLFFASVAKTVDPNAPALAAPYHMPADGTGYNNELDRGAVAPWIWDTTTKSSLPTPR